MTSDSLAASLNKRLTIAQTELKELQKQFELFQVSAKDAYEHVKKNFHHSIGEVQKASIDMNDDFSKALQPRIENMQIQVTLGKAQTKEIFEEQKRKISRSLNEFDQFISSNKPAFNKRLLAATDEVEKLRLKLDLLHHAYTDGANPSAKISIKQKELNRILDQVLERLSESKPRLEDNWDNGHVILSDTYKELRKVLLSE